MARVDPLLITFIDDLPYLEAATRGVYLFTPAKSTYDKILCTP